MVNKFEYNRIFFRPNLSIIGLKQNNIAAIVAPKQILPLISNLSMELILLQNGP